MRVVMYVVMLFLLSGVTACQSGGDDGTVNPARYLPRPAERMVGLAQKIDDPVTPRTYDIFRYGDLEWMGQSLAMKVAKSWCYDEHKENCRDYGQLYTAQSAKYACAGLGGGWRLPTLAEWKTILRDHGGYIDEDQSKVGPSPEAALLNLTNPNLPFAARIGGLRTVDGGYLDMGVQTFFWTSTEKDMYKTNYAIALEEKGIGFKVITLDKKAGGYCRCVRSRPQ